MERYFLLQSAGGLIKHSAFNSDLHILFSTIAVEEGLTGGLRHGLRTKKIEK